MRSSPDPVRLVLALDTSADVASVALLGLGASSGAASIVGTAPHVPAAVWNLALLDARTAPVKQSHTRRLLTLVEQGLEELEATPSDLGAVVVGTGPGTFTGVRLGVATARAIALSLAVPVVGVSSLSALVAAALGDDPDGVHSVVVPSIDARRGEVFAAVYVAEPVRPETRGAAAGAPGRRWRRVGEVFVCPPEDVVDEVRRRVGIAAGSLEEVVHVVGAADGMQGEERGRYPQAACLVLGQELLREPGTAPAGDRLLPWLRTVLAGDAEAVGGLTPGSPGTPESVVPEYVRAPDADVHITKMRDPWAS